jgi:hypothetical protein
VGAVVEATGEGAAGETGWEGAVAVAPPAAERMAWVEVAGGRVKEAASEGGRGEAEGAVSSVKGGLEWEAWEGATAVGRSAREEVPWGGETVVAGAAAMAAAMEEAPRENSGAAARVAAVRSSSWRSRGAWTRTGGRPHLL